MGQVAFEYCRRYGSDKVRVITLVKNRGKGGAVKMVMHDSSLLFKARGEQNSLFCRCFTCVGIPQPTSQMPEFRVRGQ